MSTESSRARTTVAAIAGAGVVVHPLVRGAGGAGAGAVDHVTCLAAVEAVAVTAAAIT
jgi:hypothetical protein